MSDQDKLIETLFLSYHDAIKKACMSYFHYQPQYMSYVDDCIQEVFVAAFRKRMIWPGIPTHMHGWPTHAKSNALL